MRSISPSSPRRIREWRRPIAVSAGSQFRLCFRLEEPEVAAGADSAHDETPGDAWYVRYLLHPHDDPSLLIPVEEAWRASGSKISALRRNGSNVREFLLSSLGQASGICPSITASLENARPAGYSLDAAKAHVFLTEEAIALEQAGYGVMLPAWWTRKGTKVRLAVQAKVKSPKMQGRKRSVSGDDCPVRLGSGPRGPEAHPPGAGGACADEGPAGQGPRSMGRDERPGHPGGDRFLEEEGG